MTKATTDGCATNIRLPLAGEVSAAQTDPGVRDETTPTLDSDAVQDFREYLEKNKDSLKTGFGAFHTDNHSNW